MNDEDETNDTFGIEDLIGLFEEREMMYAEYTNMIADLIAPTVLAAMEELLNVSDDQISWDAINILPDTLGLSISCAVSYGVDDEIPQFVTDIAPPSGESDVSDVRMVRIGLPIVNCFNSKEEILKFFHQIIKDHKDGVKTALPTSEPSDTPQFDLSELTKDQITHFLTLQHQNLGVKH